MTPNDYPEFYETWLDAHAKSSSNQIPADRVVMSVFDDLADYSLASVRLALKHHARQSRFAPTPHDVVALLEFGNKRISADEAWAMMPKSESDTVVWTQEMAEAYATASHMAAYGDKVAARMGFKAAYERLCHEAELMRKPIVWSVCLGCDKSGIEPVLTSAVALGRITEKYAKRLLPAPMDSGPIAGLLTGKVTEMPNNDANLKARWGELKQAIADGQRKMAEKDRQKVIEREQERLGFERRKQEMLDRVEARLQDA